MSKLILGLVVALSLGLATPALAGNGAPAMDYELPPANTSPPSDGDGENLPTLPPWQREDAINPEDGVDEDPTPFDPDESPQDPDPP